MKLTIRRDLGGYALDVLDKAGIDGTAVDRPFLLLTGPNASGKSSIMRAIRATIGLRGERGGQLDCPFGEHLIDPSTAGGDVLRMNTQVESFIRSGTAEHVPTVFDLKDLGWSGQPTYLFDSRAASMLAKSSEFDDDMMYHASLLMDGGGRRTSHGQFVSKTWWEAIRWADGLLDVGGGWNRGTRDPARLALLDEALSGAEPSKERWLLIDEPETAIDAETLLVGLAALLRIAEIGKLRIVCASHSLLFAAGLMHHPKIQVLDLGADASWLRTQEIVLKLASDRPNLERAGDDMLKRIRAASRKETAAAARRKPSGRTGPRTSVPRGRGR